MSTDSTGAALASILETLASMQEQLDLVVESGQRIEATHQEILARLDKSGAGQATTADVAPILKTILGRSIDDREITRKQLATIATAVGFAHSAANGLRAPLPVAIATDPLLERFLLNQPPDMTSAERSMTDWRRTASAASTGDLIALLNRQLEPSPTDTPETRILRYRLAALTRAKIRGRGTALPRQPAVTVAADRTASACMIRSSELAQIWRGGETAALYADPELAGTIDLFVEAERQMGATNSEDTPDVLVTLHQEIATRLESGERPRVGDRPAPSNERASTMEPGKDR